jgi:hypothetical protein
LRDTAPEIGLGLCPCESILGGDLAQATVVRSDTHTEIYKQSDLTRRPGRDDLRVRTTSEIHETSVLAVDRPFQDDERLKEACRVSLEILGKAMRIQTGGFDRVGMESCIEKLHNFAQIMDPSSQDRLADGRPPILIGNRLMRCQSDWPLLRHICY